MKSEILKSEKSDGFGVILVAMIASVLTIPIAVAAIQVGLDNAKTLKEIKIAQENLRETVINEDSIILTNMWSLMRPLPPVPPTVGIGCGSLGTKDPVYGSIYLSDGATACEIYLSKGCTMSADNTTLTGPETVTIVDHKLWHYSCK